MILCFLQSEAGRMVDQEMLDLPAETFGRCKAPAGTWASAIRIIDPVEVRKPLSSQRLLTRRIIV